MAVHLGTSISRRALLLLESPAIGFHPPPRSGLPGAATSRRRTIRTRTALFAREVYTGLFSRNTLTKVPRCSGPSSSDTSSEGSKATSDREKASFGYSRKDVLLIGLGVTIVGIGLKSGLEFVGVDPLQAGNVVQLVLVLGLTVGWISTYIFRVSNKNMTYAQQLRDYENKVMQKRLEGLTEAELEALLEQVEEEKRRFTSGEQV